jgi:hypothetical protein
MVMKWGLGGENVGLSRQPALRRPDALVRRIGPVAKEARRGREAIRALKRQLVRPVFRLLVEGSGIQLAAA